MSYDTVKRKYSLAYVVRPRSTRENACIPAQKPWALDPDSPDPSRSVILDLQDLSEWDMSSIVAPEQPVSEFPVENDMQAQCLPGPRPETPQGLCCKVPKISSFRSYNGIPTWYRKP